MRNHVRHSRSDRTTATLEEGTARDVVLTVLPEPAEADDADDAFEDELQDVVRLHCPDCARPIAVFTDEDSLPEHALCASPWNPFGLTVCTGSGRPVEEALPVEGFVAGQEQELALLLTLPDGLDWRTQPFSHAGGPGSRPLRVPVQRAAETRETNHRAAA